MLAATELVEDVKPVVIQKMLPKAKLQTADFKLAQYAYSVWAIELKFGQTRSELLRPDFYAHIAARLKKNDRIEVLHEEGNYFAELIVVSAEKIGIKVGFLRELTFETLERSEVDSSEFYTKFRGPRRWSILRHADHSVVEENIPTEGQATQKLREMTAQA